MPKLFAVDSMAVLYRGYFAMIRTPLINSKGLNTSGIRTFLMQLIKIIEEDNPDYLAVASDSMEPTFRHKTYPEYKATREKMPEDLVEQLPYLPKLVEALNLPYLILPGYEADDIVGTLMRLCRESEIDGVMVSSDKDYMQLITEKIVMLNHRNEHIGISEVEEKFGCLPEKVVEMLGLMGDSSDNIPGVRGVGEKTAVKLISEFGSIEGVYENLERVSSKSLKLKLEIDHENALLSKELATIDCHVPLSVKLEDFHLGQTDLYNNDELYDLLEELEFRTLMNRLIKKRKNVSMSDEFSHKDDENSKTYQDNNHNLSTSEEETDSSFLEVEYFLIQTAEQFRRLISKFLNKKKLALALNLKGEHQLDLWLKGLAICADGEKAFYINLNHTESERTEINLELKTLLEYAEHSKIFYDFKKAVQYFSKLGIQIAGVESDILLAAHMTDPLVRRYDLDYLLGSRLNMKRKYRNSVHTSKQPQMNIFEESDEEDYISHCENAAIIYKLHEVLLAQLKLTGMEGAYRNIEIPLASTLAVLEMNGIKLDVEGLKKVSLDFEERLTELRNKIIELSGEKFNPNSVIELQNILYEKLRLHEKFNIKPKKIKLGNRMSTDEETLEKLSKDRLPRTILDYRTINKLKNTYIDQLPGYVNSGSGKIHSTFHQTGTATGRLSSENPNLQNIPVRTNEGRRVRRAFIPSVSENILISADYSQIELRVVAHYSKDPTFIDAYRRNLDIHSLTASTIFGIAEKDVTREMRDRAKEVNFGLIYRMGAERLSLVTKTSKSEAKEFIERYFEKYSTIHALQERFLEQARKEGFAETLFGRRRYLPDINTKGLLKRMAEGAAINTPIQGSAAEIIKLAMINVGILIREKKMQSRMVLTVHDELVFDAIKEEELELIDIIKNVMENVVGLEVPLLVEIGKGETWLDAH